ncbi:15133_t:CDS:2, partial [Gigaspora rosea]
RECDKAIDIRKPAQKTEEQMDSTQITNVTRTQTQGHDEGEIAEMLFCDCGWPFPTYDDCGITLLCGAHYWTNKIPDVRPLGYPFDRPFKNNSYKQTFEGLSNAANRDFKIVWTDTDFQEV